MPGQCLSVGVGAVDVQPRPVLLDRDNVLCPGVAPTFTANYLDVDFFVIPFSFVSLGIWRTLRSSRKNCRGS